MFLSDHKRAVLKALRHGPMDHHQIAVDLQIASWLVREDLKYMRTDRLVAFHFEGTRVLWHLTGRGIEHVRAGDQLQLGEEARA